jgi:hypothetical protein
MKLVKFDYEFDRGFKIPTGAFWEATKKYREIETTLTSKYGPIGSSPSCNMILKLAVLINTMGNLKDKTILDIGCGAKNSWDYGATDFAEQERFYDPWLCRAAHELGAKVFGIDGASSPNEEYTHIQENLLNFGEIMNRFQDHSIDLACAWSFFDSPNLCNGKSMFRQVLKGLERKVKPEGSFVFEAVCTGVLDNGDWESFLAKRQQIETGELI